MSVLPVGMSLEDLVKTSHYIVLVEKQKPFVQVEKMPLRSSEDRSSYYERKSFHCKIIKILYSVDKTRGPKAGEIIRVYESGTDEHLEDIKLAAQSPPQENWPIAIEQFYHEDTPAENEDSRIILFLTTTFKEHYEMAVHGGYELESKIGQVNKIIGAGGL